MRRIKHACLAQNILFQLNEHLDHQEAVRQAQTELLRYKADLDRKGIRYIVDEESALEDGTPLLRIRKQYNNYSVGSYFD